MSLPLVLILLSFGIALTQAASDSRAVTLRWLRLGDLIALSLLGIAGAALIADPPAMAWSLYVSGSLLAVGTFVHLMLVQSGQRKAERIAIGAVCTAVLLTFTLPYLAPSLEWMQAISAAHPDSRAAAVASWPQWLIGPALTLAAWLTGGSLMTMLLGHAYLTSGNEMTQQPFIRLVRLLIAGLVVRLTIAGLGALWPWWAARAPSPEGGLEMVPLMMMAARFLVGFAVPLIMTWMALQCVRIRSNQSATGILYVSSTMILVGEFLGLSLVAAHGLPF